MTNKIFRSFEWAGVGLGLVVLALLTGCADSPPWSSTSKVPSSAQFQAVLGRQSSYVYFASYEIYYDRNHDRYIYQSDGAWITRTEPPQGVSMEVLLASPSVAMTFSDAPERHHAAVTRSYPRNWGRKDTIMASAR